MGSLHYGRDGRIRTLLHARADLNTHTKLGYTAERESCCYFQAELLGSVARVFGQQFEEVEGAKLALIIADTSYHAGLAQNVIQPLEDVMQTIQSLEASTDIQSMAIMTQACCGISHFSGLSTARGLLKQQGRQQESAACN